MRVSSRRKTFWRARIFPATLPSGQDATKSICTPIVTLQAAPIEDARRVVGGFPGVSGLETDGEALKFSVGREALPALTRRLVEERVAVTSIIPRRSLEEYFLAITEGASDVARTAGGRR